MEVEVKRVLNKHRRDSWFLDDFSLNPYYSCDFNCVYCYVKGSKYGSENDISAAFIAPPAESKAIS